MWYLNEDARTIACIRLAPARPSVFHALEHGECITYNLVRFAPFDVCNKPNSTGVFLK